MGNTYRIIGKIKFWTHVLLLHPPFLPWSFPTKNSTLPGSGDPGSKEGMMLSFPSHAQGSDFSQSDRKGHWPWRSHFPSSHGHPQKHPSISLIFPHNREKQQVSLTAQSCPQGNIMRFLTGEDTASLGFQHE